MSMRRHITEPILLCFIEGIEDGYLFIGKWHISSLNASYKYHMNKASLAGHPIVSYFLALTTQAHARLWL